MLTSVAALWLAVHLSVKRRFNALAGSLPEAYQAAFAVPTPDSDHPRLIALAIDLLRKKHACHPFDSLTAQERRIALFAYAAEKLPLWMVRYNALTLSRADRQLVQRLCDIRVSRPQHKPQHFGAIEAEKQLRLAAKT
ncbi:hypothetical protein [Yoonia sp. BS5-3]|uniref:Uncharacterized protein n=1 Tax=Yoonia phaeophyticola TaxID=3137369 RepID=A0ABZ2V974_9RHOB